MQQDSAAMPRYAQLHPNPKWDGLENLVVVCGHSVYGGARIKDWHYQANWIPGRDDPTKYAAHIRAGIQLTSLDKKALLVFSGGQTRHQAGPRSEAIGYWLVADFLQLWHNTDVEERTALEEFARDSFENLLFAICRFHKCVGNFPNAVTLVSFLVKQDRFDLHRGAIGWTANQYKFVGPNDPDDPTAATREQTQINDYTRDPFAFGQ